MLLFKKAFHAGLVEGRVRLTFRRWEKPHVRPGGRYRCHPIGVLEVDRVDRVLVRDITEDDARLSGFESREELIAFMREGKDAPLSPKTEVFRVELHHAGDGDRVEIALDDSLSDDDVKTIAKKLAKMDEKEKWTLATLRLIEKHPQVAASQLAKKVGREREPFKIDVRRLKRLGLTQSFEVGYELSPRGRAYLDRARRRRPI